MDLAGELVGRFGVGQDTYERLDDVAAQMVGRGDRSCLDDLWMGDERRLDLEGADPVAGGDNDVVVASLVPDVAVVVLAGDVARVEPVAAEDAPRVLVAVPVAERVVRVGARAKADLPGLADWWGCSSSLSKATSQPGVG